MIKIKLNNNVKVVTQGAYNEFYEYLGYEIVNDKKPIKEVEIKKPIEDKTETKEQDKSSKQTYSRK